MLLLAISSHVLDFHRRKTSSQKKISFSTDARKSRHSKLPNKSGALISADTSELTNRVSPPPEKLLSTNPFLKAASSPAAGDLSHLADSGSDLEEVGGSRAKPKMGILKRSDESGGSQVSLGEPCNLIISQVEVCFTLYSMLGQILRISFSIDTIYNYLYSLSS